MTPRIPKLVLAAVLALSVPAAANGDCDHHPGPGGPAAFPAPHRADPAPRRWSEAAWRDRQLNRIRAELRALDVQRTEFHARHAGKPGKLRKYDRWYLERRAELEHRRAELLRYVAWR